MGNVSRARKLKNKCIAIRHARYRLLIVFLAASVHIFAAALCLAPYKKVAKLAPIWIKQAKGTVNMERHRKRKCRTMPLFEI